EAHPQPPAEQPPVLASTAPSGCGVPPDAIPLPSVALLAPPAAVRPPSFCPGTPPTPVSSPAPASRPAPPPVAPPPPAPPLAPPLVAVGSADPSRPPDADRSSRTQICDRQTSPSWQSPPSRQRPRSDPAG